MQLLRRLMRHGLKNRLTGTEILYLIYKIINNEREKNENG
mgnify:CR=1 FL=1|jgi:hypothetical protein